MRSDEQAFWDSIFQQGFDKTGDAVSAIAQADKALSGRRAAPSRGVDLEAMRKFQEALWEMDKAHAKLVGAARS